MADVNWDALYQRSTYIDEYRAQFVPRDNSNPFARIKRRAEELMGLEEREAKERAVFKEILAPDTKENLSIEDIDELL